MAPRINLPKARETTEPESEATLRMVRLAGTFAGMLSRRRQMFERISSDAGIGFAAWVLEQVITPLFPIAIGPGRALDLGALRAGALVRVVVAISRADAARVGKVLTALLLILQMNRYAVEKRGAKLVEPKDSLARDPRAFLEAALSPTTRRLARRTLSEQARRLGVGELKVDFAAMYRTGTVPAVRFLPVDKTRPTLPATRDGAMLLLLGVLVFACDCWALGENPLNVAFAAMIQHGSRLWETGTPKFRTAMTEALVVATCETLPTDKLEKLNRMEAVSVLEGEVLDWASSVVIAFHEMRGHSLSRFRLMRYLRDLVNRANRKGPELEQIGSHLHRLGHRVLALDDAAADVADERADPGRVVPEIHELRARLHLEHLTPRERRVLALRMNDMPFDDIGRELGISAATARVLMYRVRRASGRVVARGRRGRR